jgi:hypothetical protein
MTDVPPEWKVMKGDLTYVVVRCNGEIEIRDTQPSADADINSSLDEDDPMDICATLTIKRKNPDVGIDEIIGMIRGVEPLQRVVESVEDVEYLQY